MIRVLHCIGSLEFGGSQGFVMNMYREVDRTKMQFDFVVFPEDIEGHYEEVSQLGGKIYVCPRFNAKNSVEFIKWWHAFFKEHKEYRIVHGHVRSVAAIYLTIAKKYGLRTIIHSHSTSNGHGFEAMVKAILQKPLPRIADYLFACSDVAGEWLYGKNAVKWDNYRMIPNGINCQRFAFSDESRNQTRQEWNIPRDAFVIGHVGRFHEAKNHLFLVRIFERILQLYPGAILLLVGDGELKEEITQYWAQTGILDHVRFTGNQVKTEAFYAAMDVLVFPSKWEGLPVSVVEAQASGLPCLISDAVTQNVKLTDLVKYLSIREREQHWVEETLRHAHKKREEISKENFKRMQSFEIRTVAKEMQEFYLSL